jgi:hypothetical protein
MASRSSCCLKKPTFFTLDTRFLARYRAPIIDVAYHSKCHLLLATGSWQSKPRNPERATRNTQPLTPETCLLGIALVAKAGRLNIEISNR